MLAGDLLDSQECVERGCPTDCVFQEWGDWEACTSSCGSGVHKRSRTTIPASYGGKAACLFTYMYTIVYIIHIYKVLCYIVIEV